MATPKGQAFTGGRGGGEKGQSPAWHLGVEGASPAASGGSRITGEQAGYLGHPNNGGLEGHQLPQKENPSSSLPSIPSKGTGPHSSKLPEHTATLHTY